MKKRISEKVTRLHIKKKSALHVKKGILLNVGLLFTMAFVITACGNSAVEETESEEETDVSEMTLDTLDVENVTSVKLQLTDRISVDATVTSYDDYKNGVSAYELIYADEYYDSDPVIEERNTADNLPGLFGKTLADQVLLLEEQFGTGFDLANVTVKVSESDNRYYLEIPDQDGTAATLEYEATDEMGRIGYMKSEYEQSDWNSTLHDAIGYQVKLSNAKPENAASDVQESFAAAKELTEELTGWELSDYNLCLKLNDSDYTYGFLYYYSVDGLPLVQSGVYLSYSEEMTAMNLDSYDCASAETVITDTGASAETMTADTCVSVKNVTADTSALCGNEIISVLYSLNDSAENQETDPMSTWRFLPAAKAYYLDGELIGLFACKSCSIGDTYYESKEVINAKEVLQYAQNYFELTEDTRKITITDIRLVYNAQQPEAGGEIVLWPTWYLMFYDATAADANCNRILAFDAYTGNCMGEDAITLNYFDFH